MATEAVVNLLDIALTFTAGILVQPSSLKRRTELSQTLHTSSLEDNTVKYSRCWVNALLLDSKYENTSMSRDNILRCNPASLQSNIAF